jgi:hypothetical protein
MELSIASDSEMKNGGRVMTEQTIQRFKTTAAFQRTAGACLLAVVMLTAGGCAMYGMQQPKPVTVDQVLQMGRQGMSADEVVRQMKASGTVYRLKASQLAELKAQGVPDAVIDYMQQTYLDAVREDARYDDWRYWTMNDDYWYGGAPYGWPYDRAYIIRGPHEDKGHEKHEHPR